MEPESASVPLLGETHLENCKISALESASVPDADTVKNTHNTYKSQSEVEGISSDSLKNLFGSDFCHVCGAVLQFESQRVSHYEGKKHAQKVRLYLQAKRDDDRMNELTVFQQKVDRDRFCKLCNMVFSAPVVAKSHYEGKVHAKNLRKLGLPPAAPATPQTGDLAPQGTPLPPSSQAEGAKEVKEEARAAPERPVPPGEAVDLSDLNRHCSLCSASFNTPQMARQHYGGRKHQRSQARLRALRDMEERGQPGAQLDSHTFSCPVCNMMFNSVEMYQAHMQGNKHQQKEMKVADMISRSQKKVYDSFQDELADYIQVQKARGLEPRTGPGGERGEGREEEEEGNEGEAEHEGGCEEEEGFSGLPGPPLIGAPMPTRAPLPPALFHPASWRPPFPAPPPRPPFGLQAPDGPPWGHAFQPMALPLMPVGVATGFRSGPRRREAADGGYGRERRRCRRSSRDRSTSSDSSSYSSSSSSSSTSSSSDDHSRRERKRKKMRKERGRRAKDEDSEEDEKRRERRSRRQRRKGRRPGEKKREEGPQPKRRREVELGEEVQEEGGVQATEWLEEVRPEKEARPDEARERGKVEKGREGKHKHRREKKRTKERTGDMDTRTEEEKLWDESILGLA